VKLLMSDKSNDLLKKLNDNFQDFLTGIFGESTVKQMNDFSSQAIKTLVEFGDKVVESLNLTENELVKKSSAQIKDLLKQAGLLEEESEDDF
jgi:transcription initiation factor IIF auxiliary subunit